MLLAFTIASAPIDPDGPAPAFVVDRTGFRAEFEAWPVPAPRPLDADVLCTVLLSVSPDGARADLVNCPDLVAPAVVASLQNWRLRASSAPPSEGELLRLAWMFRAGGTVEGFASAPGALSLRVPPELKEVVNEELVESWAGCHGCDEVDCRVRVDVDAGGRPTATSVSSFGSPFFEDCPQEAWDAARAAAVASRPWPVLGADGWPTAYTRDAHVQLRRGPGGPPGGPGVELRGEFPVEAE